MKKVLWATACAVALSSPAFSQEAPAGAIPATAPANTANTTNLPANTEVVLRMNEEVSTKKNDKGDTFYLTVVHDVMVDNYIAIPKGARAMGEVTWKTGKGAFGKSGKLDIEIRYVEVAGHRVPLIGKFRQEGEGNTVATVAAVALVWVAAPFITGKTGRIPAGRELIVHTADSVTVALPANAAPAPAQPAMLQAVAPAAPATLPTAPAAVPAEPATPTT
ncbi:hypothetical protein MZO42_08015 [Sphingomonas psychrotolerans]|uniref:Uncharacterized protein n=1 Tax=Sphingomonas psychrotolerans TaxID=1327635 RepID=A0ABU3N267_9SPHN|nr:hypothetical protein [Sphingomonas psychrotolerans]MDT8758640.1 hypothetical protein [Sphingomonas psychrotolerans]